jgi:UDP-3-O-[3-hydroxymyristoyl] glucosamine N-acyltransferase
LHSPPEAHLSDFADIDVLRDGAFSTLGFIDYPQAQMLAFAESPRFLTRALALPEVSCLVTTADLAARVPAGTGVAISATPRVAFAAMHNHLARMTKFYGHDFRSEIAEGAEVHPRAYIAECNVRIGRGASIGANACVLEGSTIGDGAVVGEGCVVGGSGLQVVSPDDAALDIAHTGTVTIDEGAVLLANCVVARGLFHQATFVGRNVRAGNLTFISHNVRVGQRSVIGHGVKLCGHSQIGADVILGPGVVVSDGVRMGDGSRATLGSVVVKDVPAKGHVTGNFAMQHRRFLRRQGRAGS